MTDVHDEIQPLIAAYAMGAVPEDEIPAIRAHILTCEICFAEAESYTDTLSALAASVPSVPLPAGFAERVVAEARGGSSETAPEPVSPSRRRWSWRSLIPAVAVLSVLSLIGTSVALVRAADRQRDYMSAVASLVHDPNAFALEGPGGAEARLASTDDGLVLVAVDLGEAPTARDYQLWLIKDGVPTPGVTFDAGDPVVVVEGSQDLEGYEGAAITVEPDGGSRQPTTDPVLST